MLGIPFPVQSDRNLVPFPVSANSNPFSERIWTGKRKNTLPIIILSLLPYGISLPHDFMLLLPVASGVMQQVQKHCYENTLNSELSEDSPIKHNRFVHETLTIVYCTNNMNRKWVTILVLGLVRANSFAFQQQVYIHNKRAKEIHSSHTISDQRFARCARNVKYTILLDIVTSRRRKSPVKQIVVRKTTNKQILTLKTPNK